MKELIQLNQRAIKEVKLILKCLQEIEKMHIMRRYFETNGLTALNVYQLTLEKIHSLSVINERLTEWYMQTFDKINEKIK